VEDRVRVLKRQRGAAASWGTGLTTSAGEVHRSNARTGAADLVLSRGFSLIEVLIAISIFCIVAFAVLQLLITSLGAARSLQIRHVDVSVRAAEFAATNNLIEEGIESGDFGEFYPHARWESNAEEVGSNSLFQVDFVAIEKVGKAQALSDMSILLYRPGSPKGKMSGGTGRSTGLMPNQ
jgi:prepilin-type N-terminal cleavage/methylation domain-containing protein